ncbi:MAG: glycosyltransferase family 2 protein [Verrucomicrobiales bacterium]|nr:glycosyltransferase family 2 protein [Verrucomicrobiales bacterium]
MPPDYAVITPVRNEAEYLPLTIASMQRQTHPPKWWVLVDDGSTDNTAAIAEEAAEHLPWLKVIRRSNRGFRLAGKGVVDAFYDGYREVENEPWAFVSKFDGDLSFDPDYFERCLEKFAGEPRLGVGGGMCCFERDGQRHPEFTSDPPFHVRGPTKIYRRECWQDIGGLLNVAGWDGIDELKANLRGWESRTFPDIPLTHHRPTGSADGTWKNQTKFGRANYIMGYHPLFMAAKIMRRALQPPYLLGAAGLGVGYAGAWIRRIPQVNDPELIRFVRAEQLKTLRGQPSLWRPNRASTV